MHTLIGQKPMLYQSIKHIKSMAENHIRGFGFAFEWS